MPSGIIIIDKPRDWTSMDVCAKLRGVFGEKRIGHAGTLDPMAAGVLPVFVGRATRAVQFAETGEKEYVAGLRLGLVTNTQDVWGETVSQSPAPFTPTDVEAVLPRFTGEIEQVPPMFSAIKINGQKLYDLARKGVEVERKSRKVTIFSLELLPGLSPEGDLRLRVRCSRGTYIRTLCHDIGQALGCGGCMSSLTRTEACGFSLDDAHPLEEIVSHPAPSSLLRPVDALFSSLPSLTVNAGGADRLRHGNRISLPSASDGPCRVYGPDGEFLLLGEVRQGLLITIKSFFDPVS